MSFFWVSIMIVGLVVICHPSPLFVDLSQVFGGECNVNELG